MDVDCPRLVSGAAWSLLTLAVFALARRCHRRWPTPLLAPILVTPVVLGTILLATHTPYGQYIAGTQWLVVLLGPAVVAFAVPVWEQRALVRAHWPVLLAAMVAGSLAAITSG